jgi:predicted hotdog family 3-hydroxylacyl-ACP dehydratase
MEKRSDRHIRDLVAHAAFQGLDANEIRCVRISMLAGSRTLHTKGRIQMSQTIISVSVIFDLQRTAGPYRCAITGREQSQHGTPYSITSSAIASSPGGTASPNAFAVCRLMTNSYLVDCSTGRSAGFAPLRMRPA